MKNYKQRIKYQRIASLVVRAPGNPVTGNALRTDGLYKYITGLAVTITGDENGFTNSTFQLSQIDNQEIFPPGYDVKLLMMTINTLVAPNDRFYNFIDIDKHPVLYPANNSRLDITYLDGAFPGVVYPYTVNIWLRLENPDEEKEGFMLKFIDRFEEFFKMAEELRKERGAIIKSGEAVKTPQITTQPPQSSGTTYKPY